MEAARGTRPIATPHGMPHFERSQAEPWQGERHATGDRFVGKQDKLEDTLKLETVGLVQLEDFQRRRQQLQESETKSKEESALR